MSKISSKRVPVVTAVALLAGVFSVTSVHAERQTCEGVSVPGAYAGCLTNSVKVTKGKTIEIKAWSFSGTTDQFGTFNIYRNSVKWMVTPFYGYVNAKYTADATKFYQSGVVSAKVAKKPMHVLLTMIY